MSAGGRWSIEARSSNIINLIGERVPGERVRRPTPRLVLQSGVMQDRVAPVRRQTPQACRSSRRPAQGRRARVRAGRR